MPSTHGNSRPTGPIGRHTGESGRIPEDRAGGSRAVGLTQEKQKVKKEKMGYKRKEKPRKSKESGEKETIR